MQGWVDDLAAGEPGRAVEMMARGCRRAGQVTGVDPEAVWQWAFVELTSTGLLMLRLGRGREAERFLAVASKLAHKAD
ncbi:hypothetical protein [Actinoplanes sp. TFC3]|uniref:hypothetical protein n=1 Tax=Actinoplanes sp. TFC3 TaxID=1710355 RepID=UPI00083006D9|nr:hypothetical protein [Actinoplanes sp. TFC3]